METHAPVRPTNGESSFVVYVDESGCDGFNIQDGSSHWLVLSAAVFRKRTEATAVQVVDRVTQELNKKPNKPLHFVDLNHTQRVLYSTRVAAVNMRAVSVIIHKPSITERGAFQIKNHLYNYACRLLIERISWLCAAHRRQDEGNGFAEMIFSHRRTMSYGGLRDYLRSLKMAGTEINWNAIDPERVRAAKHADYRGLQIADCVASSFFQGLHCNRFGFTEGRYALALRPIVWAENRSFAGAGVKLFPAESLKSLDLDGQHQWLARGFGIKPQ